MKNIANAVRETARRTIKEFEMLTDGTAVVIGFSGGPDSLCLFDLLFNLKDEYNLKLYPVHINHGLRGEASESDMEFCKRFSEEKGLTCKVYSFDCKAYSDERGITTEEAGREFRYNAFLETAHEVRKSNPSSNVVIALAQNADDQAETVLMRILRGTGTDGLAGIPYVRKLEDIDVVRPLLSIYREEIESYCDENGLTPRIDETNKEPLYQRNKIRLELIPMLEKYNPAVKEALNRLALSASEDRNLLENVASIIYEKTLSETKESESGNVSLELETIRGEHPAIKRRVISMALKAAGLKEDVGAKHYASIVETISSESPSAHVDLPNGYAAWREYSNLVIGKAPNKSSGENIAESKADMKIEAMELSLKEYEEKEKEPMAHAAFDLDLLKRDLGENVISELELRERRPGDEIKLSGGTKKLQDLLVDMKVPKGKRDDVRVVALGNRVLWAIFPGCETRPRYTSEWKITENTKNVAYIVLFV